METCEQCGREVEKLIAVDDADASAHYTSLTGTHSPTGYYLCVSCAHGRLGITEADLIREERTLSQNSNFSINLLKGRIGQVILEIVFRNFGYEVYPFGYESYLTNIIKNMRKDWSNDTVRQIRSTPDTLVYDREYNQGFLLEIKSTTQDIDKFWIDAKQLSKYIELWGVAILTVVHIPTSTFYCKKFSQIKLDEKEKVTRHFSNNSGYEFNLEEEFEPLDHYFRLIDPNELNAFTDRLKNEVLKKYGS